MNRIDTSRRLTVGEVSQRSGLPVSTIHFYESKGLIQSERTSGNQRRYSPAILRYLAIVKVAQPQRTIAGRSARRSRAVSAGRSSDCCALAPCGV